MVMVTFGGDGKAVIIWDGGTELKKNRFNGVGRYIMEKSLRVARMHKVCVESRRLGGIMKFVFLKILKMENKFLEIII